MLKINKQLNRPDGGKVNSGSIVKYSTRFNTKGGLVIWYFLDHYLNSTSLENGKKTIPETLEVPKSMYKECTEEEWAKLNEAKSAEQVELWLKEGLEGIIGEGYIEII